jgi:hypothetical protein
MMEKILFKLPQSLSNKKKYTIFLSVAAVYMLLQVVLCLVQRHIKTIEKNDNIFTPINTVPLLGLEFLNIFSTALLIKSIQKLRILCHASSNFRESKIVVIFTLTLFTVENVSIILCLCFQLAYIKKKKNELNKILMTFHFIGKVGFVCLMVFIAAVII